MKPTIAVAFVLFLSAGLQGNPVALRPFPLHLVGETVEVQLLSDVAIVSGVYQFANSYTLERKLMYLPVFVGGDETPVRALARAKIEFELGGERFESITPCEPPITITLPPSGPRVQWFVVDIDEQIAAGVGHEVDSPTVRITYEQPLIQGIFYYLPVIVGPSANKEKERVWTYQMHAVARSHVLRVLSDGTDYEKVAGGIVVFLRHGSVVALK